METLCIPSEDRGAASSPRSPDIALSLFLGKCGKGRGTQEDLTTPRMSRKKFSLFPEQRQAPGELGGARWSLGGLVERVASFEGSTER